MGDDGLDEGLGQIVEGGPEEDDVEFAAGEVERLLEEGVGIEDGIALRVLTALPVAGAGVADEVGKEDAVTELGEEVNVGGRSGTDVDDAQTGFRLEALAQHGPGA